MRAASDSLRFRDVSTSCPASPPRHLEHNLVLLLVKLGIGLSARRGHLLQLAFERARAYHKREEVLLAHGAQHARVAVAAHGRAARRARKKTHLACERRRRHP
eukprot:4397642-Pleurochrysis_carterae.AAC.1